MSKIEHNLEPSIGIHSDVPLSDPVADEFGYAGFAKQVASAVVKTPSPQGLVMAIHGPWGAGKSTLLNFVKHYLQEEKDGSKPLVIDFNPWWFDDKNQLAGQFLAQFSTKLKLGPSKVQKAGDLMAQYSGALGKAVALSTGHVWVDVPIGILLKFFKLEPKDVPKLKTEITKALREGNHRVVCIIDDIDRLTPVEIREVFKVVKALADFPNLVYLLSFDRRVVANALAGAMDLNGEAGGEAYLEKIIQVPFHLPAVDRVKLQHKLFSELNRLLVGADLQLLDQTYWGNIFLEGMAPQLTKPRDIVRYVNALAVTFPVLRDEVNIADFFALEFLRINQSDLYETIRDNAQWFAGRDQRGLMAHERTEEREFHQAWAAKLDESFRSGIQAMMERLFPRLDDMGRGAEFESEWRKMRRAAAPEMFPNYFQFAVGADRLSRNTMISFIDGLEDQGKTEATLLNAVKTKRSDGSSKARDFLEYFRDYTSEIDSARAINLLRVLSRIGDQLIVKGDESYVGVSLPSSVRLGWVMQHALSRVPEDKRDTELISSFKDGDAVTYLCEVISMIEACHQKPVTYGPAATLTAIKPATLFDLKGIALNRIELAAARGQLLEAPELVSLLVRWRDWRSIEAPRKWIDNYIMPDRKKLLVFLEHFLRSSTTTTFGDHVGRVSYSLGLKFLCDFIDLAEVDGRLVSSVQGERCTDTQELVIATFQQQYKLFNKGKDPDSFMVRMGIDDGEG